MLAHWLGISERAVTLIAGPTNPEKTFLVEASPEDFSQALSKA
jgi:uncharacterized protein YggU (UPF0235/DUF167 family)